MPPAISPRWSSASRSGFSSTRASRCWSAYCRGCRWKPEFIPAREARMAESSDADRGPLSRGGIGSQPLFAVGGVLLGSFLANFDSRLTTVGLPDLRGAFSLGFDEGAWLSTASIGSQIFLAPAGAWVGSRVGFRPVARLSRPGSGRISPAISFLHRYPGAVGARSPYRVHLRPL